MSFGARPCTCVHMQVLIHAHMCTASNDEMFHVVWALIWWGCWNLMKLKLRIYSSKPILLLLLKGSSRKVMAPDFYINFLVYFSIYVGSINMHTTYNVRETLRRLGNVKFQGRQFFFATLSKTKTNKYLCHPLVSWGDFFLLLTLSGNLCSIWVS